MIDSGRVDQLTVGSPKTVSKEASHFFKRLIIKMSGRTMRKALILVPLALAACGPSADDPRVALCVSAARQAATSPSSVKMTNFEATPKDLKQAAAAGGKAVMEFEAQNSYGAKLRRSATCEFAPHPLPAYKGRFLLTAAVIGTITLTDQQLADANALDGSSRSITDAMTAAEMVRAGKTADEAK